MKYNILILLISILVVGCNQNRETSTPTNQQNSNQDSLRIALKEIQEVSNINGFSVAIVNKDKILYKEGFGWADIENQKKYTDKTIQNIASVSKTAIGIALLKAQEMGKLDLDDAVSKYLPFDVENPYFPDEKITIRHLATHTSSIIDTDIYNKSYVFDTDLKDLDTTKMEIPKEFNPSSTKTDMGTFLSKMLSKKGIWYAKENFMKNAPGTLFEYTNVGATLAAHILELATNESYDEFTKKHIFQPLNMNSSGWSSEKIDGSLRSVLYAKGNKTFPSYSLITYPDGGLLTSANDLSLYLQELIRGYVGAGSILTKQSYDQLFLGQLKAENFTERDSESLYNDEYNLGIFMGISAKDYIGHTGGDPGVSTFMFFNTKTQIGRLLIINTDLLNQKDVDSFFSIWNQLEKYQDKL